VKMDSVKLNWNYGLDLVTAIDSVEIKVFATEMVYVPNGSFALAMVMEPIEVPIVFS